MRSGREHWAGILAVEVRQGTLGGDGRGGGPAGHTGRGWSWLRSGREQEEDDEEDDEEEEDEEEEEERRRSRQLT